ncbi:hypothetical protein YC2023_086445 [Brassica napus]
MIKDHTNRSISHDYMWGFIPPPSSFDRLSLSKTPFLHSKVPNFPSGFLVLGLSSAHKRQYGMFSFTSIICRDQFVKHVETKDGKDYL